MSEPATENPPDPVDTAANLTPFKPGQSGNPGGRPKGLAATVRRQISEDDIAAFWNACLTGVLETRVYEHQVQRISPKNGRVYTRTVPEHTIRETVEIKDRIAVSKILAERGWGKPPQFIPIDPGDDPLGFQSEQEVELVGEFDLKLGDLEAKRREVEERERQAADASRDGE